MLMDQDCGTNINRQAGTVPEGSAPAVGSLATLAAEVSAPGK